MYTLFFSLQFPSTFISCHLFLIDEIRIERIDGCVRSITSGKDWILNRIIDRVVDDVRDRDRSTTKSNTGAVDRDDSKDKLK